MKRALFFILVAVLTLAATQLGSYTQVDKLAAPGTCAIINEGAMVRMQGDAGTGPTKLCVCVSDGATAPTYQWCSFTFSTDAGTMGMVCAGGSTTVCP